MTFVGRILVVVLMVFALIFLALSTVVFSTSVNWKQRVTDLNNAKTKLEGQLATANNQSNDMAGRVAEADKKIEEDAKDYRTKIKALTDDNTRYSGEVTKQRLSIEVAQQLARSSQQDAEARTAETTKLREILKAVQDQANEFKLQKTDLEQQILVLKREVEVAKGNNSVLRNSVAVLQSALRKAGLSADANAYMTLAQPPDVEGLITKVDPTKTVFEISIGANDGLVPGHELDVYHLKPQPEYIGKVRILETDPQQASAKLIGKTVYGKKIQEGDNVTTKIRPRS